MAPHAAPLSCPASLTEALLPPKHRPGYPQKHRTPGRSCESPSCIPGAQEQGWAPGMGEALGSPALPVRLPGAKPGRQDRLVGAGKLRGTHLLPMPASLTPEGPPRYLPNTVTLSQEKAQAPFQQSLGRGNRETEAHSTDTATLGRNCIPEGLQVIGTQPVPCPPAPPRPPQGNKYSPNYHTPQSSWPTTPQGPHSSVFTLCIKSFWSILSSC